MRHMRRARAVRTTLVVTALLVITACGGGGGGSGENTNSGGSGGSGSAPDTTPPTVPSGLTLNSTSASEVQLSWTASSDDVAVTGYKLYRDNTYLKTVTGTTGGDSALSASTTYCYQISALDSSGNESAKTPQQCLTTPAPSDTTAPTVPTNLSVKASSTAISLRWTASTDDKSVSGYKIYRDGQYLATVIKATGMSDSDLTPNAKYCYEVSAVDEAGNESAKTPEECIRTLLAGPTLQGPSTSTGAVTLTWTFQWSGLTSNQDGYTLQESTTGADSSFAQIFSSAAQGTADRVSPKTQSITRGPGTYYYRVNALVRGTTTDWSNVVPVTVVQPTSSTVTLNPVADNTLIYNTTNSSSQNTVFQTGDISVGCNWATGGTLSDFVCASTALMFDIPPQVVGKTIVSAKLSLYPYILAADFNTSYAANAFAGSWSASGITFANQPQFYTGDGATVAVPTSTAVPVEFNLKAIVQNWASGTWTNNGLLLHDTTLQAPSSAAYRGTSFYSTNNYPTAAKKPQLLIEYQ